MTWPIGLARRPAADDLAVRRLGLDDAAAGAAERERRPDDGRQPDRRRSARLDVLVASSTMQLGAYGWSIRSSRSRNASRSSAMWIASSGVPRSRIGVALEDAGLGQRRREVQRGLAAEAGEQALGPLPRR